MPTYEVASSFEISRKSLLVDTNVLVCAFDPEDPLQEETRFFLDEIDYQLLVPISVVVEAWGMLVGSKKRWDAGMELLLWLNTPGNAVLLAQHGDVGGVYNLLRFLRPLDCVDSMLMLLADEITKEWDLRPAMAVATHDTGDYTRALERGLKVNVYDMKSQTFQDFFED